MWSYDLYLIVYVTRIHVFLPPVPSPRYPLTSLLEGYQCARHDEHISYGNMGVPVPPFGLEFSSGNAAMGYSHASSVYWVNSIQFTDVFIISN
jgi:hypothetical protein